MQGDQEVQETWRVLKPFQSLEVAGSESLRSLVSLKAPELNAVSFCCLRFSLLSVPVCLQAFALCSREFMCVVSLYIYISILIVWGPDVRSHVAQVWQEEVLC